MDVNSSRATVFIKEYEKERSIDPGENISKMSETQEVTEEEPIAFVEPDDRSYVVYMIVVVLLLGLFFLILKMRKK